jgi:hypothetical protein
MRARNQVTACDAEGRLTTACSGRAPSDYFILHVSCAPLMPGVRHLLVIKLEKRAACIASILATPFVCFAAYLWLVARAHKAVTVAICRFNLAPPVPGAPIKCLYLC